MRSRFRGRIVALFLTLAAAGPLLPLKPLPGDDCASERLDFNRDIRPILSENCFGCHGAIRRKSGLDLRSGKKALVPADSGRAAIVPGRPDESELLRRVTSTDAEERMPPKRDPLSREQIEKLRRWIAEGAEWRAYWSFEPVQPPGPPEARQLQWGRNAVDRFILARLQEGGLLPSPEADPRTLIRRVSLDLTGLPPTSEEIEAFVRDDSPDAYERMLKRALESPAYGERWGKHWLDAAGYADSNGYFSADTDRPFAYKYRDWVIDALNRDMPFDEFVRWQLAGDEIAGFAPGADVTPPMVPPLVATHFLRNATDGTADSDGTPLERQIDRLRVIEGSVQNLASALLGLTIQCARCHDHPFEPVTQVEYYRLQAVLTAAYQPDPKRWLSTKDRVVVAATRAEIEEHKKRTEPIKNEIKGFEDKLKAAADEATLRRIETQIDALAETDREAARSASKTPEKKRSAEQEATLAKLKIATKFEPDELAKKDAAFAESSKAIKDNIARLKKQMPPDLPRIAALYETHPDPLPHPLKERGVHSALGPAVEPGVPAALTGSGYDFKVVKPEGLVSSGRRSALARWITSPRHPLFARVIANRVWQHHFGTGIVPTSDNLGTSGGTPSHPELLDFLAAELVRSGWSLKSLHRQITTSATYRQSSALRSDGYRADPGNRFLWRYPMQRLDAETIRDAMLAVGGVLDSASGGPYVPTRGSGASIGVDDKQPGARRRSVYLQHRRTQVLSFLTLFDAPPITANCTRRTPSTVTLQSLALLNSDFALSSARHFAARVRREAPGDALAQIRQAFLVACARIPGDEVMRAAQGFLEKQIRIYAGRADASDRALADLCQMILASNEFLYTE